MNLDNLWLIVAWFSAIGIALVFNYCLSRAKPQERSSKAGNLWGSNDE